MAGAASVWADVAMGRGPGLLVVLAVNLAEPYAALLERFVDVPHKRSCGPENSRYAAVIVDDRAKSSSVVQTVIAMTAHMLGSDWAMVVIDPGAQEDPTAHKDALKLSPVFWDRLSHYDRVLYFEADSLMVTRGLAAEFLEYDYVGAICGGFDDLGRCMNGGFSLRNPRMMAEALRREPLTLGLTKLRSGERRIAEDVFFSRALPRLHALMPSDDVADSFALESTCHGHPVGVHHTIAPLYHSEDLAWRVSRATVF